MSRGISHPSPGQKPIKKVENRTTTRSQSKNNHKHYTHKSKKCPGSTNSLGEHAETEQQGDVGTGTGRSIALLLKEAQPVRVVGVDLSAGMLTQAGKKLTDPRVELLQADATQMPSQTKPLMS